MKILITGAGGFIGCHTSLAMADAGHELVCADNFSRGVADDFIERLRSQPNVRFVEANLAEDRAWNELGSEFDAVIHLAAINGTRHFYERPYDVLSTNVRLVQNMLEWHRQANPRARIVFTSSSETYAGVPGTPVPTTEDVSIGVDDIRNPRFSYAISKIAGEGLVLGYAQATSAPYVIIRPHNVYGPRMGDDHVIPEFAVRLVGKEDPFVINGGENTRAFCYVDDFVAGLSAAAVTGDADGHIVNLGDDSEEISIVDLARRMISYVDVSPRVEVREAPAGSVMRRCPDITLARRLLGYEPAVSLDRGIANTVEWYSTRRAMEAGA